VQSWNFERAETVTIGRLEESDVVLGDPLVSRLHAVIKRVNDRWELIALGKNGVLVNDRLVDSVELRHGIVFRLGPNGPFLQFTEPDHHAPQESQKNRATASFDPVMLDLLGVDEERASEVVRRITEHNDFDRALRRAREKHSADED
jgi:pSer/pThr/pTyr-binding forkhead associated (FHA) protein